jgi:hypothetical protein
MPFTMVRVERTYLDAQGLPVATGTPSFRLSEPISDGATESLPTTVIACSVNASGQLLGPDGNVGVLLSAVDDPTTLPQGAFYGVFDEPEIEPWTFTLSMTMAPTVEPAPDNDYPEYDDPSIDPVFPVIPEGD